ncbi:lytic transglycosylase domain-containing protein [Herbaspirillum sp. GCM10030257]|uniref:lytic transglycosylase domain-containing protein n=1 Tax=Herbaspirillum sp. GCM10030257 TaxID=3273393 RepID=UPI00361372E6
MKEPDMQILAPIYRLRIAIIIAGLFAPGSVFACWEEAAARYRVNPYLLYAIAKTESSLNPAAINRNKNGSYDIGLMQINSSWFPTLRKYGLEEKQLYDPCTSIHVGAWILSQNMQRLGNSWNAVGAYNSSKPDLRLKYALKIYKNLPPAVRDAARE